MLPRLLFLTSLLILSDSKPPYQIQDKRTAKFSANCPWTSIVTIRASPDLPAQIWEYCTVYAIGRYTGLDPFVPPLIHRKLSLVFRGLSVPSFANIARCKFNREDFVFKYSDWIDMGRSLLIPNGEIEVTLILKYFPAILEQFGLTEPFKQASKTVIQRALAKRRTDTVIGICTANEDLGNIEVFSFFIKAMDYFRDEYGNVTFLALCGKDPVCSDKFSYTRDVYTDTYDNIERLDLAILSLCDHVIFRTGGIGLWGGLLAGGKTVYNYCGELMINADDKEKIINELVGKKESLCPKSSVSV